ncbi:RNA polymerase sigma-70 factor [Pedobacter hiemivivus]|uniref:RNA polymerase sigma-70 factor n=1 Tax=Pedobacter hiemivivus TaxID=2530454 RepID=A0A4R0NJ33_9SPHI|nr:RNA polymerase sigma-70 factor [Pedobacter hiemivivus]TCC99303.1 RNA polymerase sigma-70 factor [Pedobacter hiemivivus]TKC63850.1 RNA polymerase sigma-70 factor [Pedobacter hiemivivus]
MSGYHLHTDEELFVLIKEGNHRAYTQVFDRFYSLLYLHALKILLDEDEAKDLVQELFEMIWLKRDSLTVNGSVSAYLYASTRNMVLNQIAHKKVKTKYLDSLGEFIGQEDYLTDFYVREKELKRIIEKEISALPQKMSEIFKLSRTEYLSHKEIASRLHLSELTVKTQVKRALRILKPKLGFIIGLMLLFIL